MEDGIEKPIPCFTLLYGRSFRGDARCLRLLSLTLAAYSGSEFEVCVKHFS